MKKELAKLFKDNDVVSTKQLLEFGMTKYRINKLVEKGVLSKIKHGIYCLNDTFEDTMFVDQNKNSNLIYSNETALYLHNMIDRYPSTLSVTTKCGFHLRNKNLKIYYVKPHLLTQNVVLVTTPAGHQVQVYDIERTICDIIKNKNRIDPQIYSQGLQNYFKNKKIDFNKLYKVSKELKIQKKVMTIIELFIES